MKIEIIEENGFQAAMLGLSLNKKQNVDNMQRVAMKLGKHDGGHNKFLESITIAIDINAPRFWWSEFDTYRAGVTKQSESTMHTLEKENLTQDNFEYKINETYLQYLNNELEYNRSKQTKNKNFISEIKNALPEGFLQRRIVTTNYKTLRNIYLQRQYHRLPQWKQFCQYIEEHAKYFVYMVEGAK